MLFSYSSKNTIFIHHYSLLTENKALIYSFYFMYFFQATSLSYNSTNNCKHFVHVCLNLFSKILTNNCKTFRACAPKLIFRMLNIVLHCSNKRIRLSGDQFRTYRSPVYPVLLLLFPVFSILKI
jgi:hypothetical protein